MPHFGGTCGNLDTANHVYINGVRLDFRSDSMQMITIDTFKSFDSIIPYYSLNENVQICNKRGEIAAYFNAGELWGRNENKTLLTIEHFNFNHTEYKQPNQSEFNISM